MYINGITHPNGSLILSPKSPNLKSQSSLYSSLSLSPKWLGFFFFCWRIWLGFHQYSPYHIACLCIGENLIPSFSLLECSRKGFEDFLGEVTARFSREQQQYFSGEGFSMPPLARKPRPMMPMSERKTNGFFCAFICFRLLVFFFWILICLNWISSSCWFGSCL